MRKIKIGLLALLAATLYAGSAFAVDLVEVNVTSEPVHQFASDEKSGSYSASIDQGTILEEGDQITLDLPLTVTLSRDIDIVIPTDGVALNSTDAATIAFDGTFTNADMAYFRITGDAGTQRVTIDVHMTNADADAPTGTLEIDAQVAPDINTLTLKFFDQGTDGVFVWDDSVAGGGDADGIIDAAELAAATEEANTRCIDVSGYAGSVVKDSIDSKFDKFNVDPSDPQIAHIVAAVTFTIYECDKTESALIEIGAKSSTQFTDTETCDAFDFEDAAGYCDTDVNNLLIVKSSSDMDDINYSVTLEILTNGVYWADDTIGFLPKETAADLCDEGAGDPSDRYAALIVDGDYLAVDADSIVDEDGDDILIADMSEHSNECDVAADEAAKVLTIDSVNFVQGIADIRSLWVDMPAMNYDLDEINEGDIVQVKITISKIPCGEVIEATINVGTFGCEDPAAATYNITFPYFTEITGDNFWDGVAIVNESANDGTATLMIYEADGDIFTAEVDVDAQSMYVVDTSALLAIASEVSDNGGGVMGDSRFYMTVESTFTPIDGFAMMANPNTGESMGYLPRQD